MDLGNTANELQSGEPQKYNIVRIGDKILVDLLRSDGDIDYAEVLKGMIIREVEDCPYSSSRCANSGR